MRTSIAMLAACAAVALSCGPSETAAPPSAPAPTPSPTPRRALWVLCEGSQRILDRPERIPELIEQARALGATDLFVQVYRGGRAWFDSSETDATPYETVRARGVDPLLDLLARAHEADLRVHAWVNVLSLAGRRDAGLLRELGPEAVQVDRLGRSVLDYPRLDVPPPDRRYYRMGTPAVWLDPGVPAVQAKLVAIFRELVARYPALDGLHLDYLRYPDVLPFSPGSRFGVGLDFGYGPGTRERFRTETGRPPPFRSSLANADLWDAWRRDRVTALLTGIRDAVRTVHPALALSAAVWAYADRAYLAIFQDWRGWLESGLLDFAVPMVYTRDDRLLHYLARGTTGGVGGDRVWLGLGTWLFAEEPERAVAQWREARSVDPAGIAFFSYDALMETPALLEALRAEIRHDR